MSSLISPEVADLFARVQSREIWKQHADWITANIDATAPDVAARLLRCRDLSQDSEDVVQKDLADRTAYTAQIESLIDTDGLLVLPVLPSRGPLLAWSAEQLLDFRVQCFRLTGASSLSGLPEVVVPGGRSGPEYSVGIVGPRNSDRLLAEILTSFA